MLPPSISPRAPIRPEHDEELRALKTDIRGCRSRADIDAVLLPIVPDVRTRQFLLTNAAALGRRVPVEAERRRSGREHGRRGLGAVTGRFEGEALLVAGARSGYVQPEDHAVMRRFFPRARIHVHPEADHWPHVTAPDALEAVLRDFLRRCNKGAAGPSEST